MLQEKVSLRNAQASSAMQFLRTVLKNEAWGTTQVRLSDLAAGELQNFDSGRRGKDSWVRGCKLAVHRCAEFDLQQTLESFWMWMPLDRVSVSSPPSLTSSNYSLTSSCCFPQFYNLPSEHTWVCNSRSSPTLLFFNCTSQGLERTSVFQDYPNGGKMTDKTQVSCHSSVGV